MEKLIRLLRENLIVDFQGELTLETVRNLLTADRDARKLLGKLVADGTVNEMLLAVADCLVDDVRQQLSNQHILERLRAYSES